MNIFVARLNYDTQENDLQYAFEEFGAVDSVKIIMDKMTGRPKGFGFVEMPKPGEAKAAVKNLNHTQVGRNMIRVKKAEERAD